MKEVVVILFIRPPEHIKGNVKRHDGVTHLESCDGQLHLVCPAGNFTYYLKDIVSYGSTPIPN